VRMLIELVVQILVSRCQLDTASKQLIRYRILAGQDTVLNVVVLSLYEEAFADLSRIG
jgi:hypothetical protein